MTISLVLCKFNKKWFNSTYFPSFTSRNTWFNSLINTQIPAIGQIGKIFAYFTYLYPRANILKVENMLKNLILILTLAILVTSCSSLRSTTSQPAAPVTNTPVQSNNSVQFISNIAIRPDAHQ